MLRPKPDQSHRFHRTCHLHLTLFSSLGNNLANSCNHSLTSPEALCVRRCFVACYSLFIDTYLLFLLIGHHINVLAMLRPSVHYLLILINGAFSYRWDVQRDLLHKSETYITRLWVFCCTPLQTLHALLKSMSRTVQTIPSLSAGQCQHLGWVTAF